MLFDVPVVGPQTIAVMTETNTAALAIDALNTLLIDRAELIAAADAAGVAILASPAG
jgi:UDP-2,3-diacylglucosamine hydrolase